MPSTPGLICASLKCGKSIKKIGSEDYQLKCMVCAKSFHAICCGIPDAAYGKVKDSGLFSVLSYICDGCKSFLPNLQRDHEALKAKLVDYEDKFTTMQAQLDQIAGKSMPACVPGMIDPELIASIVSKVCESMLPKLMDFMHASINEAMEADSKKNNLVLIGLDEKVDSKAYLTDVCNKLNIDSGDILESFRDGRPPPGARPRILKIRFGGHASRRVFLTGYQGVRDRVPGGGRSWVRPDLTFTQRQKDKELRDELSRRRDAGERVKIYRGEIVPKS